MKKLIFGILVLAILFSSSCKKSNPTSSQPTNYWTFEGVTYTVDSCTVTANALTAYPTDINNSNSGTLTFYFPGSAPGTSGTYTVTSSAYPSAGHIQISSTVLSSYGAPFVSTGGNGNQTVTVTINSAGKINIVGSAIELADYINPSDSGAVSFNVTQTK